MRDEFLGTKPTVMLALHLLFERLKGKKSTYYLYIQSLPVAFDMLPYNWTLNDFHAMRGSPSFSLAIQTVCMLGFSYAYIYKKLAGNEFTFGTNKNLLTEDTFLFSDATDGATKVDTINSLISLVPGSTWTLRGDNVALRRKRVCA